MSIRIKKLLSYAGLILFFLIVAYAYVPQVLSGKIVNQSDISGYRGMAQEVESWDREHPDDKSAWTNSMFGGMPTTMLTGNNQGDWTQSLFNLTLTGERPASYLFISLLGAFLLMLVCGVQPVLAAAGAIAITFCSYNLQIIQVGHNAKMLSLAFAPYVLAAVIYTYRSINKEKWLLKSTLGAALFAMALNFQIKANHVQISYYLAIIIFCYAIVILVWLCKDKERRSRIGRFFAASALLLVLGLAGIATNANRLIPTYIYSQHTMRGGSELQGEDESSKSKGLDLEYATSWSYGWQELPNLMIPDFNGGSSAASVDPEKSETAQLLKRAGQNNYKQVAKALPMYWGPQPFTAGPMYIGSITIFLFILGLFLYKGKEKWWLLIPTIIGIFLAVGYHFMPFTKFWYYYMPFYSKFRTVSMALVILQITLPLFAFIVLDKIVRNSYSKEEFKKASLIAFAITGGFCLLCTLFPGIAGSFTTASDAQQPEVLIDAFIADRKMLFVKDSLMSLILIGLSYILLLWGYSDSKKSDKSHRLEAGIAISVLLVLNLFIVGKRYLNASHFFTPQQYTGVFTPRPVDEIILQDKELDYRVLDLSVNVFNDAWPSYFHKNIGGYSPVKLQRYQDLIERHISPEISRIYQSLQGAQTIQEASANLPALPVLSMLNNKYIIIDGQAAPVINTAAMGACWFVDNAVAASSPNEEISLLSKVDLSRTLIIGEDFARHREKLALVPAASVNTEATEMQVIGSEAADATESADIIELIEYAPNQLTYKYTAATERTAVFSEIYYPNGWTALVDGEEVEIFRANWTLRAATLPAGDHTVVMRFSPESYTVSAAISRISSIILIIIIILALSLNLFPRFLSNKNCGELEKNS